MEGVEAAPARAEAELMAKEDMVCKPVLEEECGLEAAEEVLPGAGGAAAEPAGRADQRCRVSARRTCQGAKPKMQENVVILIAVCTSFHVPH